MVPPSSQQTTLPLHIVDISEELREVESELAVAATRKQGTLVSTAGMSTEKIALATLVSWKGTYDSSEGPVETTLYRFSG